MSLTTIDKKVKTEGIITYKLINADGTIAREEKVYNRNIYLYAIAQRYHTLYGNFARVKERIVDTKAKYINVTDNYIARTSDGTTIQNELTDASDSFIEHTYRFQSDGNEHTIHGFSYSNGYCYAAVIPAFIQNGTQVLEIKYRMLYTFSQAPADLPYVLMIKEGLRQSKFPDSDRSLMLPATVGAYDPRQLFYPETGNNGPLPDDDYIIGATYGADDYLSTHTFNKLDYVNYVLNGVTFRDILCALPYISEDRPHSTYPFGALYNHSKDALKWFEDISNLASGKGYPTITSVGAETWSKDSDKEILGIQIAKSGNVGTAEYNVVQIPLLNIKTTDRALGSKGHSVTTGHVVHGRKDLITNLQAPTYTELNPQAWWLEDWQQYDYKRVMKVTRTAVAVTNPYNGDLWRYDSNDGFPATTIDETNNNVVSLSNGDIIINGGNRLVKVVNLTNSNVTSHIEITLTDIGASGSSIDLLRTDGKEYVLLRAGGLYESLDNGTTWAELDNIGFNTAVTDVASITGITISPANYNEMFFYRDYYRYCWFDRTTKTCLDITSINSPSHIGVDPVHGIWFVLHNNSYVARGMLLKFGENAPIAVNDTNYLDYNTSNGYENTTLQNALPFYDALGNFGLGLLSMYSNAGSRTLTLLTLGDNNRIYLDERYYYPSGNEKKPNDKLSKVTPDNIDRFYIAHYVEDNNLKNPILGYTSNKHYITDEPDTTSKLLDARPLLSYEVTGTQMKKWDATNSEWTDDNQPALADTTVGSVKGNAIRKNFGINESTFNGRCYLDISGGIGNLNIITGLTLLGQFNPVVKWDNPVYTGVNANTVKPEEQTIAWFSIHNKATNRGISLLYKNIDNNMVIEDYTTDTPVIHVLTATPTVADVRVAMVLNSVGDQVQVYVNNVLEGTATLEAPLSLDNSSGDLSVLVGASQWNMFAEKPYYGRLFKGSVTNIQVFDQLFTASLVNEDMQADPKLVTDTTKLLSKWDMDSTTDYQESRPIHDTAEATINGSMLAFPNGDLSADSYVKGDNYIVPVLKTGFLKGNSETLSFKVTTNWNNAPLDNMYAADGTTTVPSTALHLNNYVPSLYSSSSYIIYSSTARFYNRYSTENVDICFVGIDDGSLLEVEFTPQFPVNSITDNPHLWYAQFRYGTHVASLQWYTDEVSAIILKVDGVQTPMAGSVLKSGDRLKMALSGTSFEVFIDKDDGAGYVSVGSIDVPDCNTFTRIIRSGKYAYESGSYTSCTMADFRISGKVAPGTMFFGNPLTQTGLFNEKLRGYTSLWDLQPILADGVQITDKRKDTNQYINSTYLPNAGGIAFVSRGVTVFDSTLYGKEITLKNFTYGLL